MINEGQRRYFTLRFKKKKKEKNLEAQIRDFHFPTSLALPPLSYLSHAQCLLHPSFSIFFWQGSSSKPPPGHFFPMSSLSSPPTVSHSSYLHLSLRLSHRVAHGLRLIKDLWQPTEAHTSHGCSEDSGVAGGSSTMG